MIGRNLNRFALAICLSLIWANTATAQVVDQRETVQMPSKNVVTEDPLAAVRMYVDAFNKGDAADGSGFRRARLDP